MMYCSVVFMDEPTSGLDARAAAIVIRAVKNVALDGRTVMVTIHQPSIDIFESFDSLVLLQLGGRVWTDVPKLTQEMLSTKPQAQCKLDQPMLYSVGYCDSLLYIEFYLQASDRILIPVLKMVHTCMWSGV